MSRYQRMPVKDLVVDGRYQRELDEKRVAKIAGDFNERLFGVLEVNRRNGKAAVFDGQHRLAAAKELGRATVPCLVHSDLTPEQEAELFVQLQSKRKKVQPVEAFKARVFAGDLTAEAINTIVEDAGYRVAQGSGFVAGQQRTIASIGALERAYARGNLYETLVLLAEVWGGDEKSTDGKIIEGLSIIEEGYGHRIDAAVIHRLQQESPVTVLRRVKGRTQAIGGNPGSHGRLAASEIRKIAGLRGQARSKKAEATA